MYITISNSFLQFGLKIEIKRSKFGAVPQKSCIPDMSGIHDFSEIALNLLLLISIFNPNCRKLLKIVIYTENLQNS